MEKEKDEIIEDKEEESVDAVEESEDVEDELESEDVEGTADAEEKDSLLDEGDGEESYSKEYVDGLLKEIEFLKENQKEILSDEQLEIQEFKESMWNEMMDLKIQNEGLSDFAEFIQVEVGDKEELERKLNKFKEVVGRLKVSNGYQPTSNLAPDAYNVAKKERNAVGMLINKIR